MTDDAKTKFFLLTDDARNPVRPWARLIGATDPEAKVSSVQAPETGPGYQVIQFQQADRDPISKETLPLGAYLAFNAELFAELQLKDEPDIASIFTAIENAISNVNPGTSYEDFVREVQPHLVTDLPGPPAFPIAAPAWKRSPPPPLASFSFSRIVSTRSAADEVFWRLSAYANDHRVTSARGLTAGTYVTTDADMAVVGSGLAAVGRYALPNPFPSTYAYRVVPEKGSAITLGTVRPNFGHAGGGVEGVFHVHTGNWSVANHIRVLPAW